MIDFNLPRTRFVDDGGNLFDQFHVVVSECKEVGLELGCKLEIHCDSRNAPLLEDFRQQDLDFIAHEAVDLMQAVQTMLHMLAGKYEVDVPAVIAGVVKKNSDRGYYSIVAQERVAAASRSVPLPCPFCGCETITIAQGSTFRWAIGVCDDCGASCGDVRIDTMRTRNEEEIRAAVIEEWNKRHNAELTGRADGEGPR